MDSQDGERIIYQGHPSWRAILGFYIKGILISIAIALLLALAVDTATALIAGIALIGLAVLAGFLKRVATTYTITEKRLNIRRGIVARKVQETRLQRVQNVNFTQSVYQRLMQIGDVDFDTAAGDDYNFVFAGVADPAEVVEQVDRATHAVTGVEGVSAGP